MPVNADTPHLWKKDSAVTRNMNLRNLQQIESDRQAAQTTLDSLKSASERNEMGQYATPFSLAREIVEFVRDRYFENNFSYLKDHEHIKSLP